MASSKIRPPDYLSSSEIVFTESFKVQPNILLTAELSVFVFSFLLFLFLHIEMKKIFHVVSSCCIIYCGVALY